MRTSNPARAAGPRAKSALLILGSLAGVMAAGAASAASPDSGAPSVVVKYSRASLADEGGVKALYRRIAAAAKQVCPDASYGDLSAKVHVDQCRSQAIAGAIRQIDNSLLLALHAGRSKNG